jgi:hypothetical protein
MTTVLISELLTRAFICHAERGVCQSRHIRKAQSAVRSAGPLSGRRSLSAETSFRPPSGRSSDVLEPPPLRSARSSHAHITCNDRVDRTWLTSSSSAINRTAKRRSTPWEGQASQRRGVQIALHLAPVVPPNQWQQVHTWTKAEAGCSCRCSQCSHYGTNLITVLARHARLSGAVLEYLILNEGM